MNRNEYPTNWRNKYQQAQFRWAIFFVDTDTRGGGRRVALHQYPKRNVPYAEDMGRSANQFMVQGYLIGKLGGGDDEEVNYLQLKNNLIECLEQDGPGMLRLPLPYLGQDVKVMVMSYTITESRERGGMCTVDMQFVEYGDPFYRSTVSTPGQVMQSAGTVDRTVAGEPTKTTAAETKAYTDTHRNAQVPNDAPTLEYTA